MAISLEQLEGYLLQEDLRYVIDDECILLSFTTDDYVRPESGQKSLVLEIRVADDGRYAEICAPRLYDARRAVEVGRLAELLLHLGFTHRSARFGLDRSDGEVVLTVPFEPGDGTVTRQAFITMLRWLPGFVDFWHPVIDRAIRTGELPGVDRIGGHPEVARMIAQAGGVERFLAIAARGAAGADVAAKADTKPRRWSGWRGWRSLVPSFFSA